MGFSLIELMIGMLVFSILALSLTAMALHNLRSSQLNIMKNTAHATAQGFLEQLKSLPESNLLDALAAPTTVPLPTRSISADLVNAGVTQVESPLYLEDPLPTARGENYRRILIDLKEGANGTETEVFMDMWFDVNVTRLTTSRGYLITIEFLYQCPGMAFIPSQEDSVRVVRTSGSSNS